MGDLIKAQALARELMEFAIASGSARALCFAHLAAGAIAANTGDLVRGVAELKRGRDAAVDPFYRSTVEAWLGWFLVGTGEYDAARAMIESAIRFAEEHEITLFTLVQQSIQAHVTHRRRRTHSRVEPAGVAQAQIHRTRFFRVRSLSR